MTNLHDMIVPVWEKQNLTIEEAAAYSNIGQNKLREISDSERCPFVLWVGTSGLSSADNSTATLMTAILFNV